MTLKSIKYLSFVLVGVLVFSCKKVKLEDDEHGKLLLGKWKYQYGGYHVSSMNFIETINPYIDYEIEFLEGGKVCFNETGEISEYRIRRFAELTNTGYSNWRSQVTYGKEKDKLYFRVHYYSADSIAIETLPQTAFAPSQYNGLNVFKRLE